DVGLALPACGWRLCLPLQLAGRSRRGAHRLSRSARRRDVRINRRPPQRVDRSRAAGEGVAPPVGINGRAGAHLLAGAQADAEGRAIPSQPNESARGNAMTISQSAYRPVFAALDRAHVGSLRIAAPNGETMHFGSGGPEAEITVRDWRMLPALLAHGD